MFYMKCNGKKLEIREDNVYTTCPRCGKEHKVDLCDILAGGIADLYGTQVYCQECSAKRSVEPAGGGTRMNNSKTCPLLSVHEIDSLVSCQEELCAWYIPDRRHDGNGHCAMRYLVAISDVASRVRQI